MGGGGVGDWKREGDARGCEIVCVRVCVLVWMQGRSSDRVRYLMSEIFNALLS